MDYYREVSDSAPQQNIWDWYLRKTVRNDKVTTTTTGYVSFQTS